MVFCSICGLLALLLLLPALHAWLHNGWSWRLPHEIRMLSENVSLKQSERFTLISPKCLENKYSCMSLAKDKPNVLILGDSHGVDGYNALMTAYPDNHYILASEGGCLPYVDVSRFMKKTNPKRDKCIKHNNFIFSEWGGLPNADLIVFSSLISKKTFPGIKDTITYLRQRTDSKIIILGTSMVFRKDVPTLIVNFGKINRIENYINSFALKGVYKLDKKLKKIDFGRDVKYVSQLDTTCPDDDCKIFIDDQRDLLTYDKHHLSLGAAKYWGEDLKRRYSEIWSLAN